MVSKPSNTETPAISNRTSPSSYGVVVPLVVLVIGIPAALLLWSSNVILARLVSTTENHIAPTRWLAATLTPLFIAGMGLKKKSINASGAVTGLVVGFFLTLSNYCFLACLMTFFVTSSKATKYRSAEKKKLEEDFKEGGQRNWIQVICNGGMATVLSLLYIIDYGCGETSINFTTYYRASWLSLGVLGAFACSNGDTWASELGTVLGGSPFLITTLRKVPRGTNGGVTIGGLVFSLLGGVVIGIAHYLTVIYCVEENTLSLGPPQWPIIVTGALAGLVGSLLDSLLGATIQYSGFDKASGHIVEHAGPQVVHVSGIRILDNHSVNLLTTVIMGYFTPVFANLLWP